MSNTSSFRNNTRFLLSNIISVKSFRLSVLGFLLVFASCSTQRQITKAARTTLFQDSTVQHAHVGISLYDPATNKYLYNHNAQKYFVPASNTKLFSCYAALKYLG